MASISRLYVGPEVHRVLDRRLREMARSRGEPTWAMLDWAAQQREPFTIKDLYREYLRAGGDIGETSFHTMANKLIAKYDPAHAKEKYHDEGKYGLSKKRPLVYVQRGAQGRTGEHAARMKWGLDEPLRVPPTSDGGGGESPEQEALGDATDRLEAAIGREPLRAAMARWKSLGIHQAVADIRKTVPRRAQIDALHIASADLVGSGKATMSDVEDAENEIEYAPKETEPTPPPHERLPDAPGATSQAPSQPARRDSPPATTVAPPEDPARNPGREEEPDDDDEAEEEPAGGLSVPRQFFSGQQAQQQASPTKRPSPLAKLWKRR